MTHTTTHRASDGADDDERVSLGRLAVLGGGRMGETLISALVESGVVRAREVVVTALHTPRLDYLADRFAVTTSLDNAAAVKSADVVLLCVKPQVAPSVLREIRDLLRPEQLLLSIVAGLTTAQMEETIGQDRAIPVVRAMPNTPARIGHGMTAICGGRHAGEEHLHTGLEVFARMGRSLLLDEKHFDAATGLSASGPAFLYIVIEALAEGGVKVGLPRAVATELAAQTCLGAGHMVLETGDHPARLKDEVTTPAGCTMDGILALETGGVRVTLIKAVVEAVRRASELVDD
ncbi:MAG: pyrroline-5-carboxylate reductase [Acidobacteriota bacterium]